MAKAKGKGNLSHQNLQKDLAEYFRSQGKLAVIEAFIGRNADVLVYASTKTIAIEIQLTPQHCLENIKGDFRLGCDYVWIVCISNNVLNNIKNKVHPYLETSLWNKTKFYLTEDIIPRANNNNNITRNKIAEQNSGIKPTEKR
jgi:hypothetical protein